MSFKSLVSAVSEQCHEIKQSLALFPYFGTWDENLIAECCRLGSVVEFPPDKIILGSGTGSSHVVYFLLSGICRIVQCLQMQVEDKYKKKLIYQLCRTAGSASLTRESVDTEFSSMLLSREQDFHREIRLPDKETLHGGNLIFAKGRQGKGITDAVCKENSKDKPCENKSKFGGSQRPKSLENEPEEKVDEEGNVEALTRLDPSGGMGKPAGGSGKRGGDPKVYAPNHHLKMLVECRRKSKETTAAVEKGCVSEKAKDGKTFFIQTGVLIKGACFGLEKNTKDSFVLSGSKVKCLKIPRRFLLRHSSCNIWNRIRLFHHLYLPKDEEMLERFVSERNWIKEKRERTKKTVALKKIPNYTLSSDVPYSIRLAELPIEHD